MFLVVGATGFLGVHVVLAAAERGLEVVEGWRERAEPSASDSLAKDARTRTAERGVEPSSLASGSGPRDAAAAVGTDRQGVSPRRVSIALTSAPSTERALDLVRPRCIVNCAALSRIGDCERDPPLARRLNVDAPAEIARWCAAHGARFVHVSTDLVFGGEPPRATGYRDDDPTDPRSTYGRTKRDGELAVLAANERALVVRLPLLFGESFGRGLGASDGLVAAIERGDTPALFTDEWRTPLDVADAARTLVALALGEVRGVVHVAGPERLSRLELGLRVLRERGFADAERRVRATTRAESGMGDRPRDVSMESSSALLDRRT